MKNHIFFKSVMRSCGCVLLSLAVICVNGLHGFAQDWDWQNPLPQGVNLFSVNFPNDTIGFSVGMDGKILKTVNGGDDWFEQESGVTTTFASVFFPNLDTGYVVGYATTIHKTTNGGEDWFELPSPSPALTDVFFLNTHLGYAVGSNGVAAAIYKTVNGGEDWAVQNVGGVTFYNSVFFVNDTTGYVSGGGGRILKTTNGGETWVSQTSGTSQTITSLFFLDEQNGYGVANGRILKTTNGGTTWVSQSIFQANELYSVKFTDYNTGFAIGRSGVVLKTTNAGASWNFLTTETTMTLRSVFFADSLKGVAVGENGIMLKTIDSGLHWEAFSTAEYYEDLNDAYFPSDCNGFAVGDDGTILKTIDGGANWIIQNSGLANQLTAVYFTDTAIGYVVGTGGLIAKTIDAGVTWSAQTSGLSYDLNDVYFTSADSGYVVGAGGSILKTNDGGASWSPLASNVTNTLTAMHFVDSNLGFVVGSSGRVLKTTNGGATWNILFSGTTLDLNSVYFPTAQIGYIAGVSGHIRKTINGGTNWTQQTNNINIALKSIAFIDESNGYAVGYDYNRYGKIYQTTDGGATWSAQTISWDHDLNAVIYMDENIVYCVGNNGAILKTRMIAASAESTGQLCEGETIVLQVTEVPGAIYSWSGPNDFTSSSQNPSIGEASLAMSGEYTVLISLNDCTGSIATTDIIINESPATPVILYNGPVCAGDSLLLSTSGSFNTSYTWTGPNGFTSTDQSPWVNAIANTDMEGIYSLAVTIDNCTSEVAEMLVEVNPIPEIPIIAQVVSFCEGAALSLSAPPVTNVGYLWMGPNGFTSSEQNPELSANATAELSGTYTLTAILNGCSSASAETIVEVNAVPSMPTINDVGPICAGLPFALSTQGLANAGYTWTGPNGFFSAEQNPLVSSSSDTSMAGTYTLTTTVNNCTSAAAEAWVEVNAIPATPAVSNNGPVCESSVLFLEAEFIAEASYAWTGPNGFTSGEQNPVISSNATVDLSGMYTVVATLENCSSIAAETSVIVYPIPEAPLALSNSPVNEGTELVLSASSVPEATYSWTGPNGFTSNEQNPTVSLEATLAMAGVYEVGITVNECESDVASVLVVVNEVNSVQHQSSVIGVHVYPNPASENLWIELSDLTFNYVQLVNSLGAVIMQTALCYPATELNIHEFAAGVYYLVLWGEGNREEVRLIKY